MQQQQQQQQQQQRRFAVLPALIPDIRAVYDVYFAAFAADEDGRRILDLFFPGGVTSAEFRAAHADATLKWWHSSDSQYTFKCVDAESGDVVGMALCDVFVRPRTEEERKMPEIGWLAGEQRERAEKVVGKLWRAREAIWGGKPYIYIHSVAVDPKHQGRGAGRALVRVLVDLSNRSGLPIYLESTASAVRLYSGMGFRMVPGDVARVVHDAAVLGTEKDVEVPLMVKLPAPVADEGRGNGGKSVEEVYTEWFARRG